MASQVQRKVYKAFSVQGSGCYEQAEAYQAGDAV
jgi:hypothetical protein